MKVATVETVRAIEAAIDASVMSYERMMLNAGHAAGKYLQSRLEISEQTHFTILIGKGNNGGDGLALAHYLSQHTPARIRLYMLEARRQDDKNYAAVVSDGLFIGLAADDGDGRLLRNLISSADVVVDAVFGIGLRLPLRGRAAKILRAVNQMTAPVYSTYGDAAAVDPTMPGQLPHAPRPFVFAIDCPSGIDCDSGQADVSAIAADETITFIAAKPGLFTFPAARYVGKLIFSQIGVPDTVPALAQVTATVMDSHRARSMLPARPIDGHKGTFGKTMIVAGSPNFVGAAVLAGEAACRSGTGLVTIAAADKLVDIAAGALREPTWLRLPDEEGAIAASACVDLIRQSQGYHALLVGCGLGQHPSTREFVWGLLAGGDLPPLIMDADALNTVSGEANWQRHLPAETIITPHSGEMSRLTRLPTDEINAHRWEIAAEKAKEWGLVIVLKGAHTLVASPDGRISVIPFKTDALGTAGTGDVLAGLIAGLRAQGASAFDSARLGAYIHALAGTVAAAKVGSSRSVTAGDALRALGLAFQMVERG